MFVAPGPIEVVQTSVAEPVAHPRVADGRVHHPLLVASLVVREDVGMGEQRLPDACHVAVAEDAEAAAEEAVRARRRARRTGPPRKRTSACAAVSRTVATSRLYDLRHRDEACGASARARRRRLRRERDAGVRRLELRRLRRLPGRCGRAALRRPRDVRRRALRPREPVGGRPRVARRRRSRLGVRRAADGALRAAGRRVGRGRRRASPSARRPRPAARSSACSSPRRCATSRAAPAARRATSSTS